eukprot:1751216-Pleurochrysis_carterae.AAC.4
MNWGAGGGSCLGSWTANSARQCCRCAFAGECAAGARRRARERAWARTCACACVRARERVCVRARASSHLCASSHRQA